MPLTEPLRKQISDLVTNHRAVLFLKGTRQTPQCGFSATAVQILDELLPNYETIDVLAEPDIRDGIKEFSQWPTIPQFYLDGNFVGGSDILREMNESGELAKLLGIETTTQPAPSISVTASAAAAFDATASEVAGDALHLDIDSQFRHDLYFGPAAPGEIGVIAGGRTLLLDRASAKRADGVEIDFVEGPGGGFKIRNPNEPVRVKQISAVELKAKLDRGEVTLFDVRPAHERAIAQIVGARSLEGSDQEYLFGLKPDAPIALHCHHGGRSQQAAQQLLSEGFRNVYNLAGGIDAWSETVDPTVPRY